MSPSWSKWRWRKWKSYVFILDVLVIKLLFVSLYLESFLDFWLCSMISALEKLWQDATKLNHGIIVKNGWSGIRWAADRKIKYVVIQINWLMHMQLIVFFSLFLLWFSPWCFLNSLRFELLKAKYKMYKCVIITVNVEWKARTRIVIGTME